jgi:hypothetical protein
MIQVTAQTEPERAAAEAALLDGTLSAALGGFELAVYHGENLIGTAPPAAEPSRLPAGRHRQPGAEAS